MLFSACCWLAYPPLTQSLPYTLIMLVSSSDCPGRERTRFRNDSLQKPRLWTVNRWSSVALQPAPSMSPAAAVVITIHVVTQSVCCRVIFINMGSQRPLAHFLFADGARVSSAVLSTAAAAGSAVSYALLRNGCFTSHYHGQSTLLGRWICIQNPETKQ